MLLLLSALLCSSALGLASEQCGWGHLGGRKPVSLDHDSTACPVPISEAHAETPWRWGPWTHRPFCGGNSSSATGSYCVYTNAMAGGQGRGISIVATPETAAGVLNLAEHSVEPSRTRSPPPWALQDVLGKGKGLVATRKIAKGQAVVARDQAVVVAPVRYDVEGQQPVTPRQKYELLRRAAEQLADPAAVFALASGALASGASAIDDIMMTNSFGITVEGESFMALFPEVARINHACNANAFTHFSEDPLAMTIWAARDIAEGEEITISYTDVELTYEERQETLIQAWGFQCRCALCASSSPDAIAASDSRRRRIRNLKTAVVDKAKSGDYKAAIRMSDQFLRLVADEGLEAHYGDFYEIPAQLHFVVGNMAEAEKYVRLALREAQAYGTPNVVGEMKISALQELLNTIVWGP